MATTNKVQGWLCLLMTEDGQVLIFLSNLRTVPRARLSC